MPTSVFISPAPLLKCKCTSVTWNKNHALPRANLSDNSLDKNVEFIKQRLDDLRKLVSSSSLPSMPVDSLPSIEKLPSMSALQRFVALSTFRALAPTPLDHLCPIPSHPKFDPILALNLATYAFRAYHEPPSSAYRETYISQVGAKYELHTDFVYPSTQNIARNASGVFLLKLSSHDGAVSARINSAIVRDLHALRNVSLLRITHTDDPPDDLLHLFLYPTSNQAISVPSHEATLSLRPITKAAFQNRQQTSQSPVAITFSPIDYDTHRTDFFQQSLLPKELRLPFSWTGERQEKLHETPLDLEVTVEISFLPFTDDDRKELFSDSEALGEEANESNTSIENDWDVAEAVGALGEAIQDAAEQEQETEASLSLVERKRRDALAFVQQLQQPRQAMPGPAEWKRLVSTASAVIERISPAPGSMNLLDVNASACLFVESHATDTEVWLFRDVRHKSLVISFRGTEQVSWQDFFTDAQVFLQAWELGGDIDLTVSTGNTVGLTEFLPSVVGSSDVGDGVADDASAVHYGFLRAYMSVRDAVERGISLFTEGDNEYKLLFTGHSLGGALATIAAGDYAARKGGQICVMSYGAPKVGNFNFARRFNELVPNTFRIVNDSDLVSRMPRSLSTGGALNRYKHSGRTVLVNDDGDYWIEGESEEYSNATQSPIGNPFSERFSDLQELLEHEKQLWEQLLSGLSVKHHMVREAHAFAVERASFISDTFADWTIDLVCDTGRFVLHSYSACCQSRCGRSRSKWFRSCSLGTRRFTSKKLYRLLFIPPLPKPCGMFPIPVPLRPAPPI